MARSSRPTTRPEIATAAQGAATCAQNIMINLVQDTSSIVGQKINDPASMMIATGRANATASRSTRRS